LLAAARSRAPACILLDIHVPGKSGLDILKELHADNYPAPIFMISGKGDIPTAVDAIRSGAFDFIEKPFRRDGIVDRIKSAIKFFSSASNDDRSPVPLRNFSGREPLTRREQQVLALLTTGASNKEAAQQLGISPRTVEDHRASVMKKLGARNTAELIRIVLDDGRLN
jgi:FixJ family two-component response regulator